MRTRTVLGIVTLSFITAACSAADEAGGNTTTTAAPTTEAGANGSVEASSLVLSNGETIAPAPEVPAEFDPAVVAALDEMFGDGLQDLAFATEESEVLGVLAASEDPRVAWLLADLLRFTGFGPETARIVETASAVTGLDLDGVDTWGTLVDHLIAWDIEAPPDYIRYKRTLFTLVAAEWEPFFDDNAIEPVDYRYWSWGGVLIDDRPFDQTDEACNCIPAADNPEVTDAAGGEWYDDDRIVFGVVINGEARAYPRNIMEIREMVNDTLGGRDIAMPYCTLCGAAQVYYTDELPDGIERPVLRTSGLLSRSNKVMYDVNSLSVFDTFLGKAVTGPLAEAGLVLEQAPVVTTTWGAWKEEHPDTTILAEELALGRDSNLLETRDADGPIFPIGDVDPRLPVQEFVLGVITADGTQIAFPVEAAFAALADGQTVEVDDVSIRQVGDGLQAFDAGGEPLPSHEAFWFAWSQFYPDTQVW